MAPTGRQVWRDFVTDGVPSSGPHKPSKKDAREWAYWLESLLAAVTAAGGKLYTSRAAMNADLTPAVNTPALVIGDPVVANNGLYVKVGAAGSGSWSRVGDVPGYQFVRAENTGAGTPNAVVATSALPISGDTLVYLPIAATNTASPVTVAFNGGAALTIKTNGGNDVVVGGLVAGMVLLGVVSGSTFRLVSDQASAAVLAAAEDAAIRAEEAAASIDLPDATPATYLRQKDDSSGYEALTALQVRADINPLKGFSGDGVTDEKAKFTALETVVSGQRIDGGGKSYRIIGAIPTGNLYTNGYWAISNFEGDLTVNIPFDLASLPLSREIIQATPGQASWSEDSGWYEDGVKGVSYSSCRHQTGNRFVGITQRGAANHWQKAVPEFGRDQNDAPNGFYPNGECSIRGVEFKMVRRQAAGSGYPTDHRIYARNRARWIEATNVITPRSGMTTFRILKADLPGVEILENSTKITIITASAVGGQVINGEFTVTVNNNSFMEFSGVAINFTDAVKAGGFTIIKIPQSQWSQRTFAGGVSLGAALVANTGDDGLLTYQPAVCLSMAVIKSDLSGAVYLSAGGGYGLYVVKVTGLCAGNSECLLGFVKKQASWAGYGEPCFRVSPVDENVVYVGLRRDDGQSPALAITTNAFATVPAPLPITAAGGWGMDNNIVPVPIVGADGVENVFVVTAGNRGGNNPVRGWSSVPVYLLRTTKNNLLSGSGRVQAFFLGSEQHYDMWDDVGPSGRSSVGVGTAIALPGGLLEGIIGVSTPMDHWDRPQGAIVSYMIDLSRFIGGATPSTDQTVELSSSSYCEWTGLTADVTTGNIFSPVNSGYESNADMLTIGGVFTPDRTGWYKCSVSMMLSGNASEQSCYLWDEVTGTYLSQPAFASDLNPQFTLFRATLPTGLNMSVTGSATVYLRAGQQVSVRLGPNTTAKVTTTQNLLRWEGIS